VQIPLLAGLILIFFTVILLVGFSLLKEKGEVVFREIPAFMKLNKALGTAVEDGSRIHFALGSSSPIDNRTATSFVSLSVLSHSAELSAASEKSPLATSGDAALAILSQDNLKTAHHLAGADRQYQATSGRMSGITPFSYAAGTLVSIYDEDISTNIISGAFGSEVALLSDAAERTRSFTLAASDSLSAQAILYASAAEPLIGEELFASGAYLRAGWAHPASLRAQDILRWVIIVILVGGAMMKLLAGLL
jgi:hypothetical protein